MKRLFVWLGVLAVIALLYAMYLPAETGSTLNKYRRCRVTLLTLKDEFGSYKYKFGSYPTGDYDQILKKLFEDSPQYFRVDPWGTPYAVSFSSTNSFIISSAGPDKKFGDKDDIIFNSISNDFVKP
jgi:hypothetical protein